MKKPEPRPWASCDNKCKDCQPRGVCPLASTYLKPELVK